MIDAPALPDRTEPDRTLSDSGQAAAFEALLAWRRDVRHFDTRPVAEAEMARLFALARHAPSVGNAQPWRFLRVRTPAMRAALADHVDDAVQAAGRSYDGERADRYAALKLHGLREAPEIVAVFSDEAPVAGHGLGIATMPEALVYSTVMAIHTLWLAARAHGIGLGWVSILDPVYVTDLLDVPSHWRFVALLCIGYPLAPSDTPELEQRGWQARQPWQAHVGER